MVKQAELETIALRDEHQMEITQLKNELKNTNQKAELETIALREKHEIEITQLKNELKKTKQKLKKERNRDS
eukprot:Pgem_evm1s950